MWNPVLRGVIDRRILVNDSVDPEVMARALPAPFRPLLWDGRAMGGICLIRLKRVRPRLLPGILGISSENAAHRVAVQWDEGGALREGVYVPRRDTSSRLNAVAGGVLFPGVHHHARFSTEETAVALDVAMQSLDGRASVRVIGRVTDQLPTSSRFPSLRAASEFFERGSLGYSDTRQAGLYDGLELRVPRWKVQPLAVDHVKSSYFEGEGLFPAGAVSFDCALLMRGIHHEWHGRPSLRA